MRIIIPFGILIISILIGHFFAPYGILISPIVMLGLTLLMVKIFDENIIKRAIATAIFFSLNDIGLRLYAGGTHDYPGNAILILFFGIGFMISGIYLVTNIISTKELRQRKTISIFIFLAISLLHFILFGSFGIEKNYH